MVVGTAGANSVVAAKPVGVVHSHDHDPVPIRALSTVVVSVPEPQQKDDHAGETIVQVITFRAHSCGGGKTGYIQGTFR